MSTLSEWWLGVREDLRFAVKSLARVPMYTTTVVVTLAVAIGGVTAVFSVLYAVLLRPLPYPRAHELLAVHEAFRDGTHNRGPFSPGEFVDVKNKNHVFSSMVALTGGSMSMTGRGEATRVATGWATVDMFRLFGIAPTLGRDFAPDDEQAGGAHVAILSSAFHRRAFAGAADVVGKTIELDGLAHTIIGVLPSVYDGQPRFGDLSGEDAEPRDVWLPLGFTPNQLDPAVRGAHWIKVLARLKPGVTREAAMADLARLAETFYRDFPETYKPGSEWRMWVESLKSYGAGKSALVATLSLAAVLLVLLTGCANVVSITLARLASRRREIAVRVALGATASRIAGQFLGESLILALAAGALGVVIGRAGIDGLMAAASAAALDDVGIAFQLPVLAFALAISIFAGVLAGSAPAWHAARLSPTAGLREGGRATSASALRLRSALVVAQVTVALVLLVGTGLILRSIVDLTSTSPGFEPRDAYVAQVTLSETRYGKGPERTQFVQAALERLRTIHGIDSVGITTILPFSGYQDWLFRIEGDPPPIPPAPRPDAEVRSIAGDYFPSLGMRLVAGRSFGPSDTHDAPGAVIVSELTAKKYFNGRNPLGMRIFFKINLRDERPFTVVGIAADTRSVGMDVPMRPFVYFSFDQVPQFNVGIVVRAPHLGAASLIAIREATAAVDPTQPLYGAVPLQQLVDASLGSRRFTLLLLSLFAALGLALAVLGIYGITSYSVVQRTQEIAVRMAMGADDRAIVRLIVIRTLKLVAMGIVLGSITAAVLGKYLASLIYGVDPWDPQATLLLAVVMVAAALAASWLPARRAAALPLANALRSD
ncbi:MAG TPA: ABC transporter permease [Polyangiaceae bacterium]|nr:ABC transporter permease [Polyangiaceae bacterium]